MKEYVFEIDPEALPSLEERLLDINPLGYAIEIGKEGNYLKVYDEEIAEFLRSSGFDYLEVKETSPKDWFENHLKEPFELTDGVIVDPVGTHEGEGIVLRINPGMAFGTGLHQTTRLCARLLKKYIEPGYDVLDVGTGSGILAILSKKLGARRVIGVDNDPIAVESAKENASLSGVDVEFIVSDLLENVSGKFDIVVANIVPAVLTRLAGDIEKVLRDGALVILSGIYRGFEREVLKAYSFMESIEMVGEGEWIALTLRWYRNSSGGG